MFKEFLKQKKQKQIASPQNIITVLCNILWCLKIKQQIILK